MQPSYTHTAETKTEKKADKSLPTNYQGRLSTRAELFTLFVLQEQ